MQIVFRNKRNQQISSFDQTHIVRANFEQSGFSAVSDECIKKHMKRHKLRIDLLRMQYKLQLNEITTTTKNRLKMKRSKGRS